MFTYATVCSGVEGCSLALNAAPPTRGTWEPIFFSEIAPFPSAVLAHRFPSVPNLGDMTQIKVTDEGISNGTATVRFHRILDLLAGGTPCQDFSVAGKRGGGTKGSGTRSSLCWEWLRLVSELAPRVVLWENVPGCLSTNNGADFSRLVAALGDLGYGCAWRVLDCQYSRVDVWPMAIPQRRRRVWLVGVADADVDGAAEILFEPSCLLGRAKPERASGASLAACAGGRPAGASGILDKLAYPCLDTSTQQLANQEVEHGGLVLASINGHVINRKPENGGNSCGHGPGEVMLTETATDVHAVAVYDHAHAKESKVAVTITGDHESRVTDQMNMVVDALSSAAVRRLTPEECEALMGYPTGHTKVPYRGKPAEACPDGPRYEACGNGWAINCARWVLLGIHRYLERNNQ